MLQNSIQTTSVLVTGRLGPTSLNVQAGAYAILDVLAKSVFGAWLLFTCAKVPELATEFGSCCAGCTADEGRIRIGDGEEQG